MLSLFWLCILPQKTHRKSNIYVGALCPGPVDTEFNDNADVVFALKGITADYCVKEALMEWSIERQ